MNVDDPQKPPVAITVCTGMGGLDRGVERGIESLRNAYRNENQKGWFRSDKRNVEYAAYVEIESVAAYNLVKQMEQGVLAPAPVWSDIKTFPWEYFYGKVHILTGGYPCQPFSQAGLQNGTEDPRHLFPFIEHGIDAARPVLCFFENVANHLNLGYSEVRRRISSLGYKVEADIFSAEQVGAPHLRRRLFIMAVADTYCTEQSKRRGDLAKMLGIQKTKRQSEHGSSISGGDGEELGNSNESGSQRGDGVYKPTMSTESGQLMGYTDCKGEQQQIGEQRESRRWDNNSSQALVHSFESRLEGHGRNGNAKTRWQESVRSIASTSIWPQGQGIEQWEWEEPRLESSMGFTVNGYDFTEDLLRMAGNAVVEQQAELAFRTLIDKFL